MNRIVYGLALATTACASSSAALPKISFRHAGLVERYCLAVSPVKPEPAVLEEIDARLPEFEAAWAKEGPVLMGATVKLTGQPYRYAETLATLHGCSDMPSYSAPLLIAAFRYTRAWANSTAPRTGVAGLDPGKATSAPEGPRTLADLSEFTYTVWHESGHRYLDDVLHRLPGGTSPLLQKYAAESPMTLAHLHLMALDKLIYTQLGRGDEYAARGARLRRMDMKPLVRVFEIIEQEGADKLVAELRQASRD